jgi:hypothetical protein
MLFLLYFAFILACFLIAVLYLYSLSEMPEIPDWEEFALRAEQPKNNS